MLEPRSDKTVLIKFKSKQDQQRINVIGAYRNLFKVFLQEDESFELVSALLSFVTISKIDEFPKTEEELRKLAEQMEIDRTNNMVVVVQTIRTNKTINFLKFDSRFVKEHIRQQNIWIEKMFLKEALQSAVGWVYGVNPNHVNRIKFGKGFQTTMRNIVDNFYDTMEWCRKEQKEKPEGQAKAETQDDEDSSTTEWKVVKNKRQKKAPDAKSEDTKMEETEEQDKKAITEVDGESLYSHDDLSFDVEIPDTPQIIAIPTPVKFYDKKTKEKVETFAFEIICNRSEVSKVAECLQYYQELDKTCTFISYGMKREDPGKYNKWIDLQNVYLDEPVSIPLFGLHPDLLNKRVKSTEDFPIYSRLQVALEDHDAIFGLEESNKTDKLGKWFVITNKEHEQKAKDFLDFTLPTLFDALEVDDLSQYQYQHFPHPRRGNYLQRKQAELTARTLESLIPEDYDRKSRPKTRTAQTRQQRKIEVVFESQEQPPAAKKAKTSTWRVPDDDDNPEPVSANPWQHSAGKPLKPAAISQTSVNEQIEAALKKMPSQLTNEEIQEKIDAGLASLKEDLMKCQDNFLNAIKNNDVSKAVIPVGVSNKEMMECITDEIEKVQTAYKQQISQVQKDLSKQIKAQKAELDTLTGQLNEYLKGIQTRFAGFEKQQELMSGRMAKFDEKLDAPMKALTLTNENTASTVKTALAAIMMRLDNQFKMTEVIDFTLQEPTLMLTDGSDQLEIEDSPPDPGELPRRL